ncbi:FAD-dependent oxidoreductase [Methylopila sp. M107]|uniref:FAD-dependent oxidoreductase n=1 Tax=Methylopila sp. M107 TaxID=1101190 RepID=UPI000370E680|nr:FAD-dependent oxidoreductase [Methylopila sp. M107]
MPLTRLSSIFGQNSGPRTVWADPQSIADRYDVVVVGGGVRALALARASALEGASVALFAPGEIAAAADERAWPVLRAGKADAHRAATDLRSSSLMRRVARRARLGVEQSGAVALAASPAEVEALARRAAQLKAQGIEAWMVPTREIEALSPPLAREARFPAALYEPGAETVDVDALALALAESAAAAGAALFAGAPATALKRETAATSLDVGGRTVAADAVALADDASAIRLIREGKGRLSLVRDERSVIVTATGAPAIGPAIEAGELRITRNRAGAVAASGPFGGDAVARDLVALAPSLGGLELASEEPVTVWRGIDGLAQVGQAEIRGLWLALGFGPDALALALPAAEHLAALIAGRRGAEEFAAFAPTRRLGARDWQEAQ